MRIQLFQERLSEKNVHATIPKGNMGYDQYKVPDDCSCRTYFCCFPLALANIRPWNFLPFFEKQWTKNHPQYLSRLSRALFPTTFLEIAVYTYDIHTGRPGPWEKLCPSSWRPRAVLRPRAQFLPIRTDLGWWITLLFFCYWDLKS